jgi:hypothetical protein
MDDDRACGVIGTTHNGITAAPPVTVIHAPLALVMYPGATDSAAPYHRVLERDRVARWVIVEPSQRIKLSQLRKTPERGVAAVRDQNPWSVYKPVYGPQFWHDGLS